MIRSLTSFVHTPATRSGFSRMAGIPAALILAALVLLPAVSAAEEKREAEVVKSNDVWTAEVNGDEVYSGPDMMHAIQAAADGLTADRRWKETVNVRNSGTAERDSDEEGIKAVEIPSFTVLDFHGNTFDVNAAENNLIVPFRARGVDDIEIRNVKITGNPRYGIWMFGSVNVILADVHLDVPGTRDSQGPGIGIRIEGLDGQNRGRWNNRFRLEGVVVENTRGHGVEFWGTDGLEIDTLVTRNTGGCGILLNASRNVRIGTVDAYRANHGGGYAGFRVANNGGPNIHVDKVIARDCGRGVFFVSGGTGITIDEVDIVGATSQGILVEDTQNVRINGGTIRDCAGEGVRITSRSLGAGPGGPHHPAANVTVRNLRVSGCPWGIRETLPRSTNNRILNNDLRGNDNCYEIQGEGTVAEDNTCD